MSFVRTVLGDIAPDKLGKVYSHEHLIISGGVAIEKRKSLLLNDVDKSCEEVNEVKKYGIQTFVDMMPVSIGRECTKLVEISKKTGVNIIATTGILKTMYYHDLHWIYRYSEEQIASLFCDEINIGMDAFEYSGPIVNRLAAKAGLIKVASDYNNISKISRKLFAAAAATQKETGAPMVTHTEHGTCGLEQVELLTKLGVNPQKIIICHLDRNPDIVYHLDVASTGAYLEYDNISRIKYWPDSVTIDLIIKMIENGYEDKILLGMDFALKTYWNAYGGGPGMSYLIKTFIPKLRRSGIDESIINKLLITNPANAFSFEVN